MSVFLFDEAAEIAARSGTTIFDSHDAHDCSSSIERAAGAAALC
jgi:hypothetical protein